MSVKQEKTEYASGLRMETYSVVTVVNKLYIYQNIILRAFEKKKHG